MSELQLKFDDIEITKDSIFKQHSGLITFKVENNIPYFKVDTEKAIFSILLDTQVRMNKMYSEFFKNEISEIFDEPQEKILFKNIYNLEGIKDLIIKNENFLNPDKFNLLIEKLDKIKKIKLEKLNTSPLSLKEKELLIQDIEITRYDNLIRNEETKVNDNISKSEFVYRAIIFIKNYCKDEVIEIMAKKRYINFNSLVKAINCTTSTRLKKNLEDTENLKLSFNFINKKKLEVKLLPTSILNSIKFFRTDNSKITWLSYSISQEILELIMLPEIFASLPFYDISKIKGKYTFRLYSLLLDHIKYGKVEITKDELFSFLGIPITAKKNKSILENQILKPTLDEIKDISNLECSYTFIPNRNWNKIVFIFNVKNVNTDYNYPKIEDFSDYQARIKLKKKNKNNFDEDILNQIEKTKRNIYVQKAWNIRVENKINKIINQHGKEFCISLLKDLKISLKMEIKTTLVQYINGILNNKKDEEEIEILNEIEPKDKINDKKNIEVFNIDYFEKFNSITDEYEKLKIEEKALELGKEKGKINDVTIGYILKTREINKNLYYSIIKEFIIEVLKKK